MPGGSYAALSGMRARMEELDRLAVDLANVGTSGYKTERGTTSASERPSFRATLDSAVDVVRGGTRTDFKSGAIAPTGRDLDVAIDGRGFFVVETPAGERYTRDDAAPQAAPPLAVAPAGGYELLGECLSELPRN